YVSQSPEVRDINIGPLEHYILIGAAEGRSPHRLFDSNFYTKNYPAWISSGLTPLVHYLTVGWKLGYQPNPQFDPGFYLQVHRDVAEAGIVPLTHYILSGKSEGRV